MAKDLSKAVLLDFYGVLLTDKQRDVMELYYNQDLSLGEIAENAGITRQGALDSIHRGEGTLQEMEEKLGLYRRYRERAKLLEQIKRAAKEIDNLNESTDQSLYSGLFLLSKYYRLFTNKLVVYGLYPFSKLLYIIYLKNSKNSKTLHHFR